MREWLRVIVPAVLILIFAVPLTVIAKNRTIRGEPMVILILNMTLVLFFFSLMFLIITTVDILFAFHTPPLLCGVMASVGLSIYGGFKLSTLFLALEQYIAVAFSLRHFTIMSQWVYKMVGITWLYITILTLFSLACYNLGLETIAEFDVRVLGVDYNMTRCGWQVMTNVHMVTTQICSTVLSILTCVLLVYAAVQGLKHEKRIAAGDISRQTQRFMMRLKSFKRIVKILLLFLTMDIAGTGLHILSRWFLLPAPFLAFIHIVRVLCLIIEYWAYGLSNTIIPRAIKTFFGLRPSQVEAGVPISAPEPFNRPAHSGQLVVADLEATGN